jgi:hypothetical protein
MSENEKTFSSLRLCALVAKCNLDFTRELNISPQRHQVTKTYNFSLALFDI